MKIPELLRAVVLELDRKLPKRFGPLENGGRGHVELRTLTINDGIVLTTSYVAGGILRDLRYRKARAMIQIAFRPGSLVEHGERCSVSVDRGFREMAFTYGIVS